MAEIDPPLASAVVLPSDKSPSAEPSSLKRKQTDEVIVELDSTKRARFDERSNDHKESGMAIAEHGGRRRAGLEEERQRGKRMFGALLGVIGGGPSARSRQRQQSGTSEQIAKRRIEIEKRTQEKLKQVNEESKAFHTEQREQLKIRRKKCQWELDEDSMKVRHRNMLDCAHNLQTKSHPRIYYKPYKLSQGERDRIQLRVRFTGNQIIDEIDRFEERRHAALCEKESRRKSPDIVPPGEEPKKTNQDISDFKSASVEPQDADNPATDIRTLDTPALAPPENTVIVSSPDQSRDYLLKGEEYVQGEEDSVIY